MNGRLEVVSPEACIGCYLCCLSWARLKNGAISLAETPLRIQRDGQRFLITLEGVLGDEAKMIVESCPRAVFSLTHAG